MSPRIIVYLLKESERERQPAYVIHVHKAAIGLAIAAIIAVELSLANWVLPRLNLDRWSDGHVQDGGLERIREAPDLAKTEVMKVGCVGLAI